MTEKQQKVLGDTLRRVSPRPPAHAFGRKRRRPMALRKTPGRSPKESRGRSESPSLMVRPRRVQGRSESPWRARRRVPSPHTNKTFHQRCDSEGVQRATGKPSGAPAGANPFPHTTQTLNQRCGPEGVQRATGKPSGAPAGAYPRLTQKNLSSTLRLRRSPEGDRKALWRARRREPFSSHNANSQSTLRPRRSPEGDRKALWRARRRGPSAPATKKTLPTGQIACRQRLSICPGEITPSRLRSR